ncbi:uncharacterized protein PGTG_12907 [Puccinia graminis f. sp. tritici CRL 75-36-700-3]|uniref:Uncharacterized protein n=1 Tax=Puccinia graminis f. sp. tritici (strain CRL 75-36-700-3 / race SCCL) TaxID=418459 RepID=E3KSN7_PUCGT|nr:uncharacterized protein PGTG_12907 [Puccinia graminis f. sp. tritici CRL 75-36-700-3]EFP87323.1 hypothetical protein PGTG_12907 [Puccinia graminis f. sp. tritici CRL 75-36-700-3]
MRSIFIYLAISKLISRTWGLSQIIPYDNVNYYVFGKGFAQDDHAKLPQVTSLEKVTHGKFHDTLHFKNLSGDRIWMMDAFYKEHQLAPFSYVDVPWNKVARHIVAHTDPTVIPNQDMYKAILEKAKKTTGESSKSS